MTWGEGAQDCPLTHGEPKPSHHSAEAMMRCAWPAFLQRFFDLAYGRGVVSVKNAAIRGTDSTVVVGEDGWIPGSHRWLTVEGHGPPTVVMCVCVPHLHIHQNKVKLSQTHSFTAFFFADTIIR